MGYSVTVIPYKSTFLPLPLSPSFLILSVPLLSTDCQSCLLQSALSSRWFLTKNADSSRKLLHIKQVTGGFSEELCLSIYQAHTHTQFRVSAAVQKLLDWFVRNANKLGATKGWESSQHHFYLGFTNKCSGKHFFFFLIKKKIIYCNIRGWSGPHVFAR